MNNDNSNTGKLFYAKTKQPTTRLLILATLHDLGGTVKGSVKYQTAKVLTCTAVKAKFGENVVSQSGFNQCLSKMILEKLVDYTIQRARGTTTLKLRNNYINLIPEIEQALSDDFEYVHVQQGRPKKRREKIVPLVQHSNSTTMDDPDEQELEQLLEKISRRLILNYLRGKVEQNL